MNAKKLKRLLLVTLSCIMISVPALAAGTTDYQLASENENDREHLQISKSHVFADYPTGEYKKITVLPSVTQVDALCFTNSLWVEEVVWAASVDTIPILAFSTCPELKKVTISDNVKVIGVGAFQSNISLTSINLPKNLKSIGSNAFARCQSLKTLYIPETVNDIGAGAFSRCDSLTIHGKKNSYAYYYCKMNGIPFVSEGTASKPATDRPYIKSTNSKVVNKQINSTIVLNGKVKNADGYQYQICDNTYARKALVSKNSTSTSYTFKKAPDVWGFARVRSYKIQNGKKIYSEWSNEMKLNAADVRRDNIKLTKVTGGKKKVTAQFSKLKYSEGFDCVLKNADSGEKIILKNQKKTNVTLKNVKPGTYYLSAHAYTKLNGIKKFGAWSESKKVIVK